MMGRVAMEDVNVGVGGVEGNVKQNTKQESQLHQGLILPKGELDGQNG